MPLAQGPAVVLEDFSSRTLSNLAKQEHLARLNQLLALNKNRHCLVLPLAFSSLEPWVNNKLKDLLVDFLANHRANQVLPANLASGEVLEAQMHLANNSQTRWVNSLLACPHLPYMRSLKNMHSKSHQFRQHTRSPLRSFKTKKSKRMFQT